MATAHPLGAGVLGEPGMYILRALMPTAPAGRPQCRVLFCHHTREARMPSALNNEGSTYGDATRCSLG